MKQGEILMEIIYEDALILVVYKEAGLPTETMRLSQIDLVNQVKNYISRETGNKNPFIGLINRLDQPVEGLVLFGKTKEATGILNRSLQDGSIEKRYLALIYGKRKYKEEKLEHYLVYNKKLNQSFVGKKGDSDVKKASLEYQVLKEMDSCELLNIRLETGRHHQIRVQLSSTGTPLVGDLKYGSEESKKYTQKENINKIALCAYKIVLPHPKTKKQLEVCVTPKHSKMGGLFSEREI